MNWSGRRDSNPRPQPWQGCALPLSYARAGTTLLHKESRAAWQYWHRQERQWRPAAVPLIGRGPFAILRRIRLRASVVEYGGGMGLLSGSDRVRAARTAKTNGALIKDSDTQHFMADVIQASRDQPVIVDFWAPWCGPCKQLTPLLERVVNNAGGKVRLVKINIDENPELAQQLRIQSIPMVYGFRGGQPVDGFAGALPESQIKAFVERLTGPLGPAPAELATRSGQGGGGRRTDRSSGAHLRAAARARAGQSRGAGRARPLPDCARHDCPRRARPSSGWPRSTPTTSRSTAPAPRSASPRRPARSPIRTR